MRRAPALNIPLTAVRLSGKARREASSHLCSPLRRQTAPAPGEVVKRKLAALAAWRSSGRLHLPALLIDRHAHDLVHGWRRLLRRAEDPCASDASNLAGRKILRTPIIGLPIANHDNNQHAANENIRLQNLWDGIEAYAGVLSRLGSHLEAPAAR